LANSLIVCFSMINDLRLTVLPLGVVTMYTNGSVLTLQLDNVKEFRQRCLEQYSALVECAAFVNWRRNDMNETSVIALSFHE